MKQIEILEIQIDNVSWDETLERIGEMIRSGRSNQIVTPALEQVILARRDPEFRQVLQDASLVLADGMQVVFASRLHRTPLKARITGVDLVPAICEKAAKEGFSVFFMGGEEGIAEETAQLLQDRYPGLQVAGIHFPPYGFENDPEQNEKAIRVIQEAKPDVLFLALGCPKQEKWIWRNRDRLGVPLMMGIGGAFNFITGREKRAPEWIQKFGLEGLYRFYHRPREIWRRIIINGPYFFLLLFDLFTYRTQKRIARWIRPLVLGAVDIFLAPLSFLFSYWFYFRSGVISNEADPFPDHQSILSLPGYSNLLVFVSAIALFSLWFFRLYERNKYFTRKDLFICTIKASASTVFLLICFQFLFFKPLFQAHNFLGFSRMVFGLFGGVLFGTLFLWRWGFHCFERWLHRIGINLDRIVVVGNNRAAREIVSAMKRHPEIGNVPLGFVSHHPSPSGVDREAPFLGDLTDLARLLPARKVDEVLIADPDIPMNDLLDIVRLCRNRRIKLSIVPNVHELLGVSSEIKQIGDYSVIAVALERNVDEWSKRSLENEE